MGKKSGLFGLGPSRGEILNSAGVWEPEIPGSRVEKPLADTWVVENDHGLPALSSARVVGERLPRGCRLCRLDRLLPEIHTNQKSRRRHYGAEIAIATRMRPAEGNAERYTLTRQVRSWTGLSKARAEMTFEEIEVLLPDLLTPHLAGAVIRRFVINGNAVAALADFASVLVPGTTDSRGRVIFETQRRTVAVESETHYTDESTGETRGAASGSAAQAWRQLGLIDDRGHPTERGIIFSFFQNGEGLAIAAALEDPHYPIDELLWHLANLRASHRFQESDTSDVIGGGSERFAIVCRQAYGPVDHEGYLRLGLPVGYGEGAAEALEAWLSGDTAAFRRTAAELEIGPGDVERAYVEWLSLLRHVRGAPDFEHPRWRALREAARVELERRHLSSPLKDLPEFPQTVLTRRAQHRISFRQIPSL